jgi:hypothetical protein
MILLVTLACVWIGGWYIDYPRSEIMLASVILLISALLADPRLVVSVPPPSEKVLRDYYVIEHACYDLKLEPHHPSQQGFFGTYRAVRGERLDLDRFGLCDYAPARALVEQYEDRTRAPAKWNSNPCEYETKMYVVHASSVSEAMKRASTAILHQTPWERLDRHREIARRALEEQQRVPGGADLIEGKIAA